MVNLEFLTSVLRQQRQAVVDVGAETEWEVRPLSTVIGGGLVLSEESVGVVSDPTIVVCAVRVYQGTVHKQNQLFYGTGFLRIFSTKYCMIKSILP